MSITNGEINKVLYENDDWKVMEHCYRGYEPWYTLYVRKKFLCFRWWSFYKWSVDLTKIDKFIGRWYAWPKYGE